MATITVRSRTVLVPDSGCSLLVHGGAWAIPDSELEAYRAGLQAALAIGRVQLERGASAVEAVVAVVASMEASGSFDAGSGAVLTADGAVELDAGVMDGATLGWGAVGAVKRIAQPVEAAHLLLQKGRGEARLMVGDGAERWAQRFGVELVDNDVLVCQRERARLEALKARERYHPSHTFIPENLTDRLPPGPKGTVGCVARDGHGRLAAATSTGGTPNRPPGRVGDTPLPGCGFYADENAAASATGWGEGIATVLLCGRSTFDAARGPEPEHVIQQRLSMLGSSITNTEGTPATAGLILLLADGRGAFGFTTPRMARAGWQAGRAEWVEVD